MVGVVVVAVQCGQRVEARRAVLQRQTHGGQPQLDLFDRLGAEVPDVEQVVLDIRNLGSKSIEEVKLRLHEMGLSLKDSSPGFDPLAALSRYNEEDDDADFGDDY